MEIDKKLARPSDKWFSDRGIPLITQPLGLPKMSETIISVERYEKWYSIYAADPTSSLPAVTVFYDTYPTYMEYCDEMWRDHCIVPSIFVSFVKSIGAKIDLQTYDAVCRRYLQDWCGRSAVFTKEFADEDIAIRMSGVVRSLIGSFDQDDVPSQEDLLGVLIDGDASLII